MAFPAESHCVLRSGLMLGLAAAVATGGCSGGLKALTKNESVHQYVHPRPVDDTLAAAKTNLESQGFRVQRYEDNLGTSFKRVDKEAGTPGTDQPKGQSKEDLAVFFSRSGSHQYVGVLVFGERVDESHSKIVTERVFLEWQPLRNPSEEARRDLEVFEEGSRGFLRLKRSDQSTQWRDTMQSLGYSEGQQDMRDIPVSTAVVVENAPAEKPTTISALPKGMSVLRRERDDALEWALIEQSDAQVARAVEREDARARNVPPPVVEPAPSADAVRASGPCGELVSGVDALADSRRLVLFGDFPGTNEIPNVVGRIACQLAQGGTPVAVGLELVHSDQKALDAYLASGGTDEDRVAFLSASASFGNEWQDGRTSAAVARLIERLRLLRAAGLPVTAFAFDSKGVAGNLRNRAMAQAIEAARRAAPQAVTLVMVGNLRARVVQGLEREPDFTPVGFYLAKWGLRPVALRVRFEDGSAWFCPPQPTPRCGAYTVHAPKDPAKAEFYSDAAMWTISAGLTPWEGAGGHQAPTGTIYPGTVVLWGEDAQGGFNGEFYVGALSASPPALSR